MFSGEELKNHLEISSTISSRSLVLAEWNMNMPDNIFTTGNYRYRPNSSDAQYRNLPITFDNLDAGNYYTNATNSYSTISGGVNNDNTPQQFTPIKEKMKMLFSLEDCLKPFRPRSGINKAMYFSNKFLSNPTSRVAERPRYYMPSRDDQFKYWTSYRVENGIEYGIANKKINDNNFIYDCVPFVVYKESIPTNRIVIKMQTNVGTADLGPFATPTGQITDPLYRDQSKTTPIIWKIQYLKNNNWIDAYSFNQSSLRPDGLPIIKSDGYVELEYGLVIPSAYKESFIYAGKLSSSTMLPATSVNGYAYLVVENNTDLGKFYIWQDTEYKTFTPLYGWQLGSETITNQTSFVTDLVSPESFINNTETGSQYREFQYIDGIRLVVETMNKIDSTFDLIEISPRLVVNITDKVTDFSINKIMSDLSISSLPVAQLLASTGDLALFDDDQAFNDNNSSSIIKKYLRKNIKFNFYEIIQNVSGYDYFIPIKTLYSEGVPQADITGASINITLRDAYMHFESMPAPRLFLTEASLSYAVSVLLDYIGFTNYTFKRLSTESDPIIPFFFVAPEQNVAEVLAKLAIATQSAMYFDEYNNFVVVSKNYMLSNNTTERPTSLTLSGQNNQEEDGVYKNKTSSGILPNILEISSSDKRVYNDGKINYTERYIQRSYGNIRQSSLVDQDKTWVYKPALLWEVSGTEQTKTINEVASTQGSYVLGAMPLNSDLTATVPNVQGNRLVNNILDLGENIYWLTRYQGYLYANGEIIRYDAAEFNITGIGNVWISSNQEYQKYFSTLPFNGKIYPTGLLRIFATPYYETVDGIERLKNGIVFEHGRGQFGTPVTSHSAGISSYWSDNSYVRGCEMDSTYLFNMVPDIETEKSNVSTIQNGGSGVVGDQTIMLVEDISNITVGQIVTKISGTGQFAANLNTKVTGINYIKDPATNLYSLTLSNEPTIHLDDAVVKFSKFPQYSIGSTGTGTNNNSNTIAKQMTRNSIIKNMLSSKYYTETDINSKKTTETGTIQSSCLVMNGPSFKTTETPRDFIFYTYKSLNNAYKHFGTRMRIIGKIENSEIRPQTAIGSVPYYQISTALATQTVSIGGGSGGIAIMLNPETNNGYYLEIAALSESNITSYNDASQIHNIMFYKIVKDNNSSSTDKAVPIKLWGGLAGIVVDDGNFTGQNRLTGEDTPTVYDISIEYLDVGQTRKFFIYINNKLIKVVDDSNPLPVYNNMALFVRGQSRCMFENLYAISKNYSQNTVENIGQTLSSVFGDKDIDTTEAFRKYAMSGIVQSTYLTGIGSQQPPQYNMYFEEFGSIMRECAYFNIKYDRAYPALYAQISPTFNRMRGYTISGFQADSYGAEFLIFNSTDKALSLDDTTGNYLRIQGITFTQETTNELTVDNFFKKRSNLSDPEFKKDALIYSPNVEQVKYNKIKESRLVYGKNEFSIESEYIQTQDFAEDLMSWLINKTMVPKKLVGVNLFSIPTLQLGDIVTIDYKDSSNINMVSDPSTRFIVYNIKYSKNEEGPNMEVYLSEV
jgi:hypothetical protein